MRSIASRHPKFSPGPATGCIDGNTAAGAQALATLIKQAWAAAGHQVDVTVEIEPSHRADRKARTTQTYRIRSSTINAMPA